MREHRYVIKTCAVLLMAVLLLGITGKELVFAKTSASFGSVQTRVIYTESDEEFAVETAELAKKNRVDKADSGSISGGIRPYSSGRLIVRVRDGEKQSLTGFGATTVVESPFGVSILQFSDAEKAGKAAEKIASLSTISYVEPDDCSIDLGDTKVRGIEGPDSYTDVNAAVGYRNFILPDGSSASLPSLVGEKDHISGITSVITPFSAATTGNMSWGVSYIQADQYAAYAKKHTKRTIKVAVVDTGVSAHKMLNGRRLAGKDFVDNDNDPTDKNGHGTHVAGTIVDCTPGLNVKILPVRVMNASGVGSPSVVGNGIRYAVNQGAKVINLSLGGFLHYRFLEECITYANKKGVTVVIAAGNGGYNTSRICPAHMASPIVVTAINRSGTRPYFSNYGSSVDISAPGVGIRSCWKNGGFATVDGTSMAAPHIAAAAAMYRLMYPSYTAAKIEKLVKNYAKDLGAKGNDKYYGRGVPRMKAAIPAGK